MRGPATGTHIGDWAGEGSARHARLDPVAAASRAALGSPARHDPRDKRRVTFARLRHLTPGGCHASRRRPHPARATAPGVVGGGGRTALGPARGDISCDCRGAGGVALLVPARSGGPGRRRDGSHPGVSAPVRLRAADGAAVCARCAGASPPRRYGAPPDAGGCPVRSWRLWWLPGDACRATSAFVPPGGSGELVQVCLVRPGPLVAALPRHGGIAPGAVSA